MNTIFCFLMERALTILTCELQHELTESGVNLSHSQLVVIQALCVEEGASQSRIAAYLNKDRAAIKRTVDSLVCKGFVKREKKDKKEFALFLTDEGRKILPILRRAVDITREKYLNSIPQDRIDSMIDIFNHVYNKSDSVRS